MHVVVHSMDGALTARAVLLRRGRSSHALTSATHDSQIQTACSGAAMLGQRCDAVGISEKTRAAMAWEITAPEMRSSLC